MVLVKYLIYFPLLITSLPLFSQGLDSIRQQLESLDEQNVKLRVSVMPTVKKYGFGSPQMDSLDVLIREFDSVALSIVVPILDKHGWLGKSQIGEAANGVLFTTIQHAKDNAIRKKYFPLLKESAKNGESSLSAMATMKDRILIMDGKPQHYGTQSGMVNGKMEMLPVKDPQKLNERRKQVGLQVME